MDNKERKYKSKFLYKLIVIIIIISSVVMSIEPFFLFEKNADKLGEGYSAKYSLATMAEQDENSNNPFLNNLFLNSLFSNNSSEEDSTNVDANDNESSTPGDNTGSELPGKDDDDSEKQPTDEENPQKPDENVTVNNNTTDNNTANNNTSSNNTVTNNTVGNNTTDNTVSNNTANNNTVGNQNVVSDNNIVDSDEKDLDEENNDEVYCKQIHTHSKICYEKDISEEDRERVFTVMQMIDELPTYDEISEKLSEYEDLNDDDGYQEYFLRIKDIAFDVYLYYTDLLNKSSYLEEYITNAENLLNLTIMWETETLAKGDYEVTVKVVNQFLGDGYCAAIVYGNGKTVSGASGDGFKWWYGYVVNSEFKVIKNLKAGVSHSTESIPTDGFIVFVHPGRSDSLLGKYVTVSFDYKSISKGENNTTAGYGTVKFSDTNPKKATKNNKLTPIQSSSTKDTIKINLYNYKNKINTKPQEDPYYPIFRTAGGPSSFSGGLRYNFAESIRVDMKEAEISGTRVGINDGSRGTSSLENVLSKKLINGYPAIMKGNKSIGYLFGEENLNYVEQLNTDNIDGLFQFDEKTGKYTFDSRKNYAKYENNEFKLFKEIITPDFIQYPFGNFFPLSNIQTAQKVTDMNPAYFEKIKQSAYYKAMVETDSKYKAEYINLANTLSGFITAHNSEYGSNWGYEQILRKYATTLSIEKGYNEKLFKNTKHFSNLYSIDYDDKKDFHFGMTMEFVFVQEESKNGEDAIYKFDGDDDVLVYIDDILFLELAGTHCQVGGKINMTEGKVYYYDFDTKTGDVSTDYTKSKFRKSQTFEEIINAAGGGIELENTANGGKTFKKDTFHRLKFYYLERGAGSSLCNMEFNMVLTPERCNVLGSKSWEGDEQNISSRPKEVTIDLYQDGKLFQTTTTNAEKNWKYEFKDLIYIEADGNGTAHTYTVQERNVDDYITVYEEDKENSDIHNKIVNIKNYYMYEDIEVIKEWDDDVLDNNRRGEILVALEALVNGKEIEITQIGSLRDDVEITLSGKNEWSYKWNRLPKYKDNDITKEIIYSAIEVGKIDGYFQSETKIDNAAEIIKLTNSKLRSITFTKVDTDDNNILLEGAQFKLQKLNNKGEIDEKFTALESKVTSSDGKFSFEGLEYGKYVLTEIKTPESYNTLKNPIYIELTKEKAVVTVKDKSTEFANSVNMDLGVIKNKKGFELTETGGEGTKLFIIIGISVLVFSIYFVNSNRIVIIAPRRMNSRRTKSRRIRPNKRTNRNFGKHEYPNYGKHAYTNYGKHTYTNYGKHL